MKVCKACLTPVRKGSTGDWFHLGPPVFIQTIAREVTDLDEQFAAYPGVRPLRAETTESELVTTIEGF
jgi:hypothetical protein